RRQPAVLDHPAHPGGDLHHCPPGNLPQPELISVCFHDRDPTTSGIAIVGFVLQAPSCTEGTGSFAPPPGNSETSARPSTTPSPASMRCRRWAAASCTFPFLCPPYTTSARSSPRSTRISEPAATTSLPPPTTGALASATSNRTTVWQWPAAPTHP